MSFGLAGLFSGGGLFSSGLFGGGLFNGLFGGGSQGSASNNGNTSSSSSVGLGAVGNLFGDVFNGNQTGIGDLDNFLNTGESLEVGSGTSLSNELADLFQGDQDSLFGNFGNVNASSSSGNSTSSSSSSDNFFSSLDNFDNFLDGGDSFLNSSGNTGYNPSSSIGLGAVGDLFGDVFDGNQMGIGDVNNFMNTGESLQVGQGTPLSNELSFLFQG